MNSLSAGTSATTGSSGLGLSFITGGYDHPSANHTSSGMIRFDASVPSDLNWRNETEGVPNMTRGTMQYARFEAKGVLIAVGGYFEVYGVLTSKCSIVWLTSGLQLPRVNFRGKPRSMSQIMVYDVDTST